MKNNNLYDMHFGTTPDIFKTAALLRRDMTPVERKLWEYLKANKLDGLKFRRQHPISRYIVDFYCHKYKFVIELDGEIHLRKDVAENDKEREQDLRNLGLIIIRFKNEDVIYKIESVLDEIKNRIRQLNPK